MAKLGFNMYVNGRTFTEDVQTDLERQKRKLIANLFFRSLRKNKVIQKQLQQPWLYQLCFDDYVASTSEKATSIFLKRWNTRPHHLPESLCVKSKQKPGAKKHS